MTPINATHSLIVLLLSTWSFLLLAHYAVAMDPSLTTDTFLENLDDKNSNDGLMPQKRLSFFVGSRYGRSGAAGAAKARRLNVSPRNDRFFLGSRYGKRSGEYAAPVMYEQDTSEGVDENNNNTNNNNNKRSNKNVNLMSCIFTGVKNLYRCNNINENTFLNQLSAAQTDIEDLQQQQHQLPQ